MGASVGLTTATATAYLGELHRRHRCRSAGRKAAGPVTACTVMLVFEVVVAPAVVAWLVTMLPLAGPSALVSGVLITLRQRTRPQGGTPDTLYVGLAPRSVLLALTAVDLPPDGHRRPALRFS